jgi:hypothetical protein
MSKRVEEGRRLLALQAVSGVASPQGVERYDIAGAGGTLGNPWPSLAIRLSTLTWMLHNDSDEVVFLSSISLWKTDCGGRM